MAKKATQEPEQPAQRPRSKATGDRPDPIEMIARGGNLVLVPLEALQFLLDYWAKNQKRNQKASRSPKRLALVWQKVCEVIRERPNATVEEVFQSFPSSDEESLIYRDEPRDWSKKKRAIVQVDDQTGRPKSVKVRSLERYVTEAKELFGPQ